MRALPDGQGFAKDGVEYRIGDCLYVHPDCFDAVPSPAALRCCTASSPRKVCAALFSMHRRPFGHMLPRCPQQAAGEKQEATSLVSQSATKPWSSCSAQHEGMSATCRWRMRMAKRWRCRRTQPKAATTRAAPIWACAPGASAASCLSRQPPRRHALPVSPRLCKGSASCVVCPGCAAHLWGRLPRNTVALRAVVTPSITILVAPQRRLPGPYDETEK